MAETLEKLRPDRDLQCYFFRPSAVAALSGASPSGFTLSGSWRQQFDWAVVEWNRDNVFEHPSLRYLPDGDLSGLGLSYQESRTNCLALDSDLYPTVDWPYLRIWATANGIEDVYRVSLRNHAVAVAGSVTPASATLTLSGTPVNLDWVGFSLLTEHYSYQYKTGDIVENAALALVDAVNASSPSVTASRSGASITLTCKQASGANGNKLGVYTYTSGTGSVTWNVPWTAFQGGQSPTKWKVSLDFSSLTAVDGRTVPTSRVRKLRWTWAADYQEGEFQRSDFSVTIDNWIVTGTNRSYFIAGPGSHRIEDDSVDVTYSGAWTKSRGNFSGGSIRYTTTPGDSAMMRYSAAASHSLYLGTRLAFNAGSVTVTVDGHDLAPQSLLLAGEDVLARVSLGQYPPGDHTIAVRHSGASGQYVYLDFLEVAYPSQNLIAGPDATPMTLATDWDTDHSLALPAERTAWILNTLGFRGRANHYAGAIWFYEMLRFGHVYASGSITFSGTPAPNAITTLSVTRADQPTALPTVIDHLHVIGDTAATIAKAFELQINAGFTAIRAQTSGATLTVFSRSMGVDGNNLIVAVTTGGSGFSSDVPTRQLSGGVDGFWRTDLTASPRINRAARDWTRAYFAALHSYGIDGATAFSTELHLDGLDPYSGVPVVQRYPDGSPVILNTPAIQTNFSPDSVAYWQRVYREMADLQASAGQRPYLQFGEVQWWYFPSAAGMPFYDNDTTSRFRAQYGRDLPVILLNTIDISTLSVETAFLAKAIGDHTSAIMASVRQTHPDCRFEVLYPTDVNSTALNQAVNFASTAWTPPNLTCLKTENFGFTAARDLNAAGRTVAFGNPLGFANSQRSHLVGIGDPTSPWLKEARLASGRGFESVVLFALDQYCLIGYQTPLPLSDRRSFFQG